MASFIMEGSLITFAQTVFALRVGRLMDWDESWRDACRDLLRLRRLELQVEKPAKGLSWQTLRDEIMRDYEYDGERKVYDDRRLHRNDLANFDKGMRTTADKFKFIDRYIRQLEVVGMSDNMRRTIRLRTADQHLKTLWSMYGVKSLSGDAVMNTLKAIPTYTYAKNLDGGEFSEIFFAVDYISERGASIIIGYCPNSLTLDDTYNASEIIFYSAYLIPMEFDKILDAINSDMPETIHLSFSDLRCLIKAFRPEYRGLQEVGYADGEARITNFRDQLFDTQDDQDFTYSSVVIDYPNVLVNPGHPVHQRPERYIGASVSQRDRFQIPNENIDAGGMSESSDTDYFDTETWRVDLTTDDSYDKFVASIIQMNYKGYLF